MAQPNRKDPRNMPQKLPMDLSKEMTENCAPSMVYASTDLTGNRIRLCKV